MDQRLYQLTKTIWPKNTGQCYPNRFKAIKRIIQLITIVLFIDHKYTTIKMFFFYLKIDF